MFYESVVREYFKYKIRRDGYRKLARMYAGGSTPFVRMCNGESGAYFGSAKNEYYWTRAADVDLCMYQCRDVLAYTTDYLPGLGA